MKKFFIIAAILLIANAVPVFSWDGYDYESGDYVEIEKDNLVRRGHDIEFYDYGAGEYRSGEVQDITRTPSGVELEVYDYEAGESRTFEMED
jgi:hypothetical protein